MEKLGRNYLVHIHSSEAGKLPDAGDLRLGEIAVNHNPSQPFISFKTVDEDNRTSFATTVTQAQLSKTAKEPVVENGILTIPYAYDELLTKYNDLLERLINIENELGMSVPYASIEKVKTLTDGWKFKLISAIADASYTSTAEAATDFSDSIWESVNVPHDWSIYRDFNNSCKGGSDAGWLDGGDAWYRIKLPITDDMHSKKIYVYFDGVYMESDVYINGEKIKTNKFGYNPFYVDITEKVDFYNENVLAVFVRNQQPSTRYYSGSGIIRNVALLVGNETNVSMGDIVVSTPNIATEYATSQKNITTQVDVTFTATEDKKITAVVEILDNVDSIVGTVTKTVELVANKPSPQSINVTVRNPILWSVGNGNLYKAKVRMKYDKSTIYKTVEFGYRWFNFATDGFYLNGEKTFLKGVCLHEDHGCLGNEANESAYDRQIMKLLGMGINAIRMCHNPFPQEFINICNKRGVLLLADIFDEWNLVKKGSFDETGGFYRFFDEYYQQVIEETLVRDVNSPAIFAWLIGNEIIRGSYTDKYTQEGAVSIANGIKETIRKYDSYRPITMGDDTPSNSISLALADILDIEGINYGSETEYKAFRAAKPTKPLFGSETTSALSSRGVYASDKTNLQCSSMDDEVVSWTEGSSAAEIVKRHMTDFDYLMGMFVWTGWDYIGEPTPFTNMFPAKSSYFGIIDLAGFPKDIFYMYQSRWSEEPMVHIVGNWEYKSGENEGATRTVWVYSNCKSIIMYLNGVSCGRQDLSNIKDKYQYVFEIGYQVGTLVANGYDENMNLIAQDVIYTSLGKVSQLQCYCDTSTVGVDDYAFIECTLADANGIMVPNACDEIVFSEGKNVKLIASDNGNAASVENMRALTKKAFNGHIMAVVKPTGLGTMSLSANFPVVIKESVKCGSSRVYRERITNFINAENPTIFKYHFDDPNFMELGTTMGTNYNGNKATDEDTGKLLAWTQRLTAIGYDTYIASASATASYNAPVSVEGTNGVYSMVLTPSSAYTSISFSIVEIDSEKNVINTINDITIDQAFALQEDTMYIMINMAKDGLYTYIFDKAIKVGMRNYPQYEYVTPTKLEFNGNINRLGSFIGGTESIFDVINFAPAEAKPNIQRNAVVTIDNPDVATYENSNLVYKGLGSAKVTISCGGITAQTTLDISQNLKEWDAEWDGTTNTLDSMFTLQSMEIVENTTGFGNAYRLKALSSNGEIQIKNSGSNTAKLEVKMLFKSVAPYNNWPWGMDATAGDGYGSSIYIPNSVNGQVWCNRISPKLEQPISADTLYTFVIELTGSSADAVAKVTINDTVISDNIVMPASLKTSDALPKCKVWAVDDNFIILSVKYKHQ